MVFLLDSGLHETIQMLLQQILIILLLQQTLEKFVHVVQHILQGLVQLLRVDQGRFQHGQIFTPVIFKGKERGVHILDVNLRLLHLLIDQTVEGVNHNRRVIGDYDIDRHRGVILHPAQPFVAQEPAKDTTRKGAMLLLVGLVLLPLKAPGGFPAHVRQNLHTGLPAQEIIVILIFVIDGQQGLDVHVPVTRAEQTPEFCRYLI